MKKLFQILSFILLATTVSLCQAKTEYISDQIDIRVHEQPDINSAVTTKLSSGTAVEVLQEHRGFKRVRLKDGSQGWIDATYLSDTQPKSVDYKQLADKLEDSKQRINKLERTLQIRRDELSNARSTINELEKQAKSANKSDEPDPELKQQLAEKQQQIEELQSQIETLQAQLESAAPTAPGLEQYQAQLELQRELNQELRSRIELAQDLLTRDQLPSAEELDKWKVSLPGWYWGTLLTVLILGIAGGIGWMDYRIRRRHGGFRI